MDDQLENISKEMKRYINEHLILSHTNYGLKRKPIKSDLQELAAMINKDYQHMDDHELKYLVNKCLSIEDMKSIILNFELNYLEREPTYMTLEEFSVQADRILKRYQWRAGGFLIEDTQWKIMTSKSRNHDIMDNEILFENTIDIKRSIDIETRDFLERIVDQLNSLATNIDVELRFKDKKEDRLSYVLIWAVDNEYKKKDKKAKKAPKIGL